MTAETLITPTTEIGTAHVSVDPTQIPLTVFATGLAGVEAVTVKLSPDEGVTPATLYQNGTAVTLTATNTAIVLDAVGYYTFAKSTSVGSSGLYISKAGHM